jgi:aryl-alcohol dehydrogenase-like predicted oxidoreductase
LRYRNFGNTGWKVSEIGFGAWAIGGNWGEQSDTDSISTLHRALDLGCNFIDTAQAYGNGRSERIIARVLAERAGNERVYVATKIPPQKGMWPPSPYDSIDECFGEKYLNERVERSLRDLGVDCLDLVQLHTWSRAWNRNPVALEVLRSLVGKGLIRAIGVSSPEHDQNALIDLMRAGRVDAIQVIYNIFEQEPQAELFPVALEHGVAVVARVPFDESALTGKLTSGTHFAVGDFRNRYFAGDRLSRVVNRVEAVRTVVHGAKMDLPNASLKFALAPMAISTVIPGMRTIRQAEQNISASELPRIDEKLEHQLRGHLWRRGVWYDGK